MTQPIIDRLFEYSDDYICTLLPDLRLNHCNPLWTHSFGSFWTEGHHKSLRDLIYPRDLERFESSLTNLLDSKEPFIRFECRLFTQHGQLLWIRWQVFAPTESTEMLAIGRDVTQEKFSFSRYEHIEKGSLIGSWEIDLVTRRLYWSSSTFTIFDFESPNSELYLEDGLSYFSDETMHLLTPALNALIESGTTFDLNLKIITKKKITKWVRAKSASDRDSNGKIQRVYGSIQDITEQVDRETKLRVIAEELDTLVSNIPAMLVHVGSKGEFKRVNKAWVNETGWDLQSLESVDVFEQLYPDEAERSRVLKNIKDCTPGWHDVLATMRDGRKVYTSWANVRLSTGEILGIGTNIDDRKRLEDQNKKISDKLRLAMSLGNIGTWDIDLETNQVHSSKEWFDILGLPATSLQNIQLDWVQYIHPEDLPKAGNDLTECLEGRVELYESILRIRVPLSDQTNQPWRWIKSNGRITQWDAQGKGTYFSAVSFDITSIKKAETQLLAQNEKLLEVSQRLELANRALKFGVWDWNLKRNKVVWDDLMYDIFEFEPVNFSGDLHQFVDCIKRADRERIEHQLMETIEQKNSEFETEFRIRTRSGKLKTLKLHALCMYTEGGTISRMVGNFWDVTDQRFSELKLIESARLVSLGEMAGGIAHEINNPLAIISGRAAQLLRAAENQTLNPEHLMKGLKNIELTVDRIAKIIRGLRAVSRNAVNDPIEPVVVSQVVDEVLELATERLRNSGVQVFKDINSQFIVTARGPQLAQVLLNLINNSFDAISSSPQRWIQIYTAVNADLIQISVVDSGNGIPEKVAQRIMEPFFTTKGVGKGTGLGLSISKGIIESLGGRFYYDNHHPNTHFVLELPKWKAENLSVDSDQ